MGTSPQSFLYFLAFVVHMAVSLSVATDIRLAGLATQCAGRVEINNSSWRTICNDNWDMRAAEVVCRQLMCGKALIANHSAHFGSGTGHIWLEYACEGNETSLSDCRDNPNGMYNCGNRKQAGVVCSESLQQPNISLTFPDGGLVWSNKVAQVTFHDQFVITCSTDSSYTPGRFLLLGPVSNIFSETVNQSASFNIPAADFKHQGNYSCAYEVSLSSGNFTSTKSEPIHVIITLPWLLIASVAGGSVLLLLLVLLVVCLVLRRRKRLKLPATVVLTQVTAMNGFESEDEEERDYVSIEEEGDYVNVAPEDTTRQITSSEVEEDSDSDAHDYEGIESDKDCFEANDIYISAVDYGEEQEDEENTSGDENDYVNLAGSSSEQCLDIFGDDVYQNF